MHNDRLRNPQPAEIDLQRNLAQLQLDHLLLQPHPAQLQTEHALISLSLSLSIGRGLGLRRRRRARRRQRAGELAIALARVQRVQLRGVQPQRRRALHRALGRAQERLRGARQQNVGFRDARVGRRRRVGGRDGRPERVAEAGERVGRGGGRRGVRELDERGRLLAAGAGDEGGAHERVRAEMLFEGERVVLAAVAEDDQVVGTALVEPQVWLGRVRAEDVFGAPFAQIREGVPYRVHVLVVRVPYQCQLVLSVALRLEFDSWRRFEVVVLPVLRVRHQLHSW